MYPESLLGISCDLSAASSASPHHFTPPLGRLKIVYAYQDLPPSAAADASAIEVTYTLDGII